MLWKVPLLALSSFAIGFGALHFSVVLQSYLLLAAGMVLLLVGSGALLRGQPRPRSVTA